MIKSLKEKLHAFQYIGGKFYLLPILIALMPAHITYCEVFGGSATFLLNKQPAKVEIYNDINSDVVNFFRTLRNKPHDLIKLLHLTPYGREEFLSARNYISFEKCDLEKARKFFVKHTQSFSGTGTSYGFGISRNNARSFLNKADQLLGIARRLKTVQFENRDFAFMLDHYCKSKDVFVYLDPPYLPETRVAKDIYQYEMNINDHVKLLKMAKRSKAKVLISGYASKLYEEYLKGWNRKEVDVSCPSGYNPKTHTRPRRTEVLWYNYDI